MNCASFTNLLASTKFPAHSVDGGRAVSASVGMGRLIALLVMAATEFVAVAVSAYFAAIVHHRLILLYSPDPPSTSYPKRCIVMLIDVTCSAASSDDGPLVSRLAYLTWLSSRSLSYQRWYENAEEYDG
jgi:hypothetical protein